MVSREDVIELARTARVALAPNFHGRSAHGATFEKLAQQLLFTFHLKKDPRPDHPRGYIAHTRNWGGEVYRVDLDLAEDANGNKILIVTGWKIDE